VVEGTIFLEIGARSIAVFRMTDEQERPRRIRNLRGRLTWRAVVQDLTGIRSMKIDDSTAVTCTNVKPWAGDIVEVALTKDDDRDLEQVARFLCRLREADLKVLHRRFGSLLTEEALTVLGALAGAVRRARLPRRSLKCLAAAAGVRSSRDLQELTAALKVYGTRRAGDRILTRYRNAARVPARVFTSLIEGPPPKTVKRRAELFSLWFRTDPRRKLLTMLLKDATWKDGTLTASLLEPWELVRRSNRASATKSDGLGVIQGDLEVWLPTLDAIRTLAA
jgi:hypothetical protein